jgi:hypothetical protein
VHQVDHLVGVARIGAVASLSDARRKLVGLIYGLDGRPVHADGVEQLRVIGN